MDSATCNVIYVDRNVHNAGRLTAASNTLELDATLGDSHGLRANLSLLLAAFGEGKCANRGDIPS